MERRERKRERRKKHNKIKLKRNMYQYSGICIVFGFLCSVITVKNNAR